MPSKRWSYVVLGFIINLCLGTVYSWSAFRPFLHKEPYRLSPAESIMPFSLFLLVFGLTMPFSGLWIRKTGVRKPAIIGGFLTGLGYISCSLVGFSSLNPAFTLSVLYGVVAGLGVGIAYNVPITVSSTWIPDNRGLAVGLTVMGFGLSALITAPIATILLETLGLSGAFLALGAAFLSILTVLGSFMKYPSQELSKASKAVSQTSIPSLTLREALKTPSFYSAWLIYFIGAGVGLMIIGSLKPIGLTLTRLEDAAATFVVSLLAVANASGRPLMGKIADILTPKKTIILMFLLDILTLTLILPLADNLYVLIAATVIVGVVFGGFLAVMPLITANFYGPLHLSSNYGALFTAYGFGGLTIPVLASILTEPKPTPEGYMKVFQTAAILTAIGLLAALLLKPPKRTGQGIQNP